jgi:FkbM family methyltransferase
MKIKKEYYNLLARIRRSQLKKRFDPLIIRKNTTDFKVFRDIFAKNELDLDIKITPKLIIDAGAYVGYSSMYYATKYPESAVCAIEPNPILFNILLQNTKNISNIFPINAGIWYKKTKLQLIDNEKIGEWAYETIETKKGQINSITINEILKLSNCNQIDILKLDIEGSEKELFSKNYKEWLNKTNIIVIEFHDRMRKDCSATVYSAINKSDWIEKKKHEKTIFINKRLKHEINE